MSWDTLEAPWKLLRNFAVALPSELAAVVICLSVAISRESVLKNVSLLLLAPHGVHCCKKPWHVDRCSVNGEGFGVEARREGAEWGGREYLVSFLQRPRKYIFYRNFKKVINTKFSTHRKTWEMPEVNLSCKNPLGMSWQARKGNAPAVGHMAVMPHKEG